ncbi:GyrI-like domain-containing protein [Streptomyces sp. SBT349]|uniref:GyrI-like domain-containing protein n=1 Tax=Streptomyces sp. SBT349 TaxID=1580539 RepID=UPI00066A5756|nr:GyrI-like domain-containing protein [Streptomyces sp. SBT349]
MTPSQQAAEPSLVERPERPYAGIRASVTMDTIGEIADRIREIFAWLAARGIEPTGAPFLRYHVIDMANRMDMEAGVPTAAVPEGEPGGDIFGGALPAGRYATVAHHGHPDDLVDVTEALLDWATDQGLTWDAWDTPEGHAWRCRLEEYLTDPAEEPDMSRWDTVLAFRLADGA